MEPSSDQKLEKRPRGRPRKHSSLPAPLGPPKKRGRPPAKKVAPVVVAGLMEPPRKRGRPCSAATLMKRAMAASEEDRVEAVRSGSAKSMPSPATLETPTRRPGRPRSAATLAKRAAAEARHWAAIQLANAELMANTTVEFCRSPEVTSPLVVTHPAASEEAEGGGVSPNDSVPLDNRALLHYSHPDFMRVFASGPSAPSPAKKQAVSSNGVAPWLAQQQHWKAPPVTSLTNVAAAAKGAARVPKLPTGTTYNASNVATSIHASNSAGLTAKSAMVHPFMAHQGVGFHHVTAADLEVMIRDDPILYQVMDMFVARLAVLRIHPCESALMEELHRKFMESSSGSSSRKRRK